MLDTFINTYWTKEPICVSVITWTALWIFVGWRFTSFMIFLSHKISKN